MDISAKIKSIRESRGILQKEIANSLQMEQSNYSRFEQRGSKITIEQLEAICSVLGVSLGEFFNSENEKDLKIKESKEELLSVINQKNQLIDVLQFHLIKSYKDSVSVDVHNLAVECINLIDIEKTISSKNEKLLKYLYEIVNLTSQSNTKEVEMLIALIKEKESHRKVKPKKSTK